MNWQGGWRLNHHYAPGDVVLYEKQLYCCTRTIGHGAPPPSDADDWIRLSGNDGDAGPYGSPGPPGMPGSTGPVGREGRPGEDGRTPEPMDLGLPPQIAAALRLLEMLERAQRGGASIVDPMLSGAVDVLRQNRLRRAAEEVVANFMVQPLRRRA